MCGGTAVEIRIELELFMNNTAFEFLLLEFLLEMVHLFIFRLAGLDFLEQLFTIHFQYPIQYV